MEHVYVQMNQKSSKLLASDLGAQSVVCLQEMKMKMVAKTSCGCKGFTTLVCNLLRFGLAAQQAHQTPISAWFFGFQNVMGDVTSPR